MRLTRLFAAGRVRTSTLQLDQKEIPMSIECNDQTGEPSGRHDDTGRTRAEQIHLWLVTLTPLVGAVSAVVVAVLNH
jgi:hypothetical protein